MIVGSIKEDLTLEKSVGVSRATAKNNIALGLNFFYEYAKKKFLKKKI